MLYHSASGRYTKYEAPKYPEKVKIHYFLHPLYQQEVPVIDKRDYIHEKYFLIKFFDNIVYIPVWMTDPEYCSSCTIAKQPRCCLEALHQLCLLLKKD